jgi:hypothetical protein
VNRERTKRTQLDAMGKRVPLSKFTKNPNVTDKN